MTESAPRRVALVGTAPSSIHAPIKDPSWDIWGVGFRGEHMTRVTRWYELHRLAGLADGPDWNDLCRKWAEDCEMWMIWPEDFGPSVRQFPAKEIAEKYGTFFMTSSFAWMLAHAIEEMRPDGMRVENGDEIGIWGVDMEYGTEYREQRAGVRHFTALAKALGIKVTLLVNGGVIYEPVPYPFWQDDPLLQKVDYRTKALGAKLAEATGAVDAALARLERIAGAREVAKAVEDAALIAKLDGEEKLLRGMLPKLQTDAAMLRGALDELAWTADYLRP